MHLSLIAIYVDMHMTLNFTLGRLTIGATSLMGTCVGAHSTYVVNQQASTHSNSTRPTAKVRGPRAKNMLACPTHLFNHDPVHEL
jgi:hypothetical protein